MLKSDWKINVPLTREDALRFWVEYLQAAACPENQCSDNNPPTTLKLMVKPYSGDDENFTEADLYEDDAENITDGTWEHFQLWQ